MLKSLFLSIFVIFSFVSLVSPTCASETFHEKTGLNTLSSITTLAQTAVWLNKQELAVGRWDGTITLFHCEEVYTNKLSILQALVPPLKQGITMLERIHDFAFVSSNGDSSIALWEKGDQGFSLKNTYDFNNDFGTVDSAKFLKIGDHTFLLTGHSEGYLLVWEFSQESLTFLTSVNLQSSHPIDSPYLLRNIRSIIPWKEGLVVTASEDGDLCLIDMLKNKIVQRQKYNPEAKRGINHICISGDYLLLSNCSVGASDQNLWLYRITNNQFVYLDSKHLIKNENLEQVFSFNVGCFSYENTTHFFCSTEEGLLWFGQIQNDTLHISNFKKISPQGQGGAAIAINPINKRIASVSYDINLLEVESFEEPPCQIPNF